MLLEFDNIDTFTYQTTIGLHNFTIVFIGHYNMPEYAENKLMIAGHSSNHLRFITDESMAVNVIGLDQEVVVCDTKKARVKNFCISEEISGCADRFN